MSKRAIATYVLSALLFLPLPAELNAETPNRAVGFRADGVYDVLGVDTVSKFNGNLTLLIPIGITYPVSEKLSYGITLVYNANDWEYRDAGSDYFLDPSTGNCMEWKNTVDGAECATKNFSYTEPNPLSNAGVGWTVSLGRIVRGSVEGAGWAYESPDGALHQFYPHLSAQGPTYQADVFYTVDGTYLRQKKYSDRRVIEFPDGSIHTFRQVGTGGGGAPFILTEMRDRWNNHVTVAVESQSQMTDLPPSEQASYSSRWVISDRHGRKHRIYFKPAGYYEQIVARIELEGFQGVLGAFDSNDSVYEFSYGEATFVRPCSQSPSFDPDALWSPTVPGRITLPVLTGISFPDGSSYVVHPADYEPGIDAINDDPWRSGTCGGNLNLVGPSAAIRKLMLPTGGSIEWDWQIADFPVQSADALFFKTASAVSSRSLRDSSGLRGTWNYVRSGTSGDLVTRTHRPDGTSEAHYFWIGTVGSGVSAEYGLPFSRASRPENRHLGANLFISSVTMKSGQSDPSNAEKLEFVQYEGDGSLSNGVRVVYPDSPRQVVRSRSEYRLASGNYEYQALASSDFDGYGHYRTIATQGNIGGLSLSRTSTRRWNPTLGSYGEPSFAPILPGDEWLTQIYDMEEEIEGASIARKEVAFDSKGALAAVRTYAGQSRGPDDLIVRYGRDAFGQVELVSNYGGDGAGLSTANAITSSSFIYPSCADYGVEHSYSAGILKTSQNLVRPFCGTRQRVSFLSVDRAIDVSTGLIASERDTATVQTSYSFDRMGRLARVNSSSGATTTYSYQPAAPPYQMARVWVETRGKFSQLLQKSDYQYDAFGRLARMNSVQPNGSVASVETRYDANGRKTAVSEQESAPTHFTTYSQFDAFDRPRTITGPDGAVTTLFYSGKSQIKRTRSYASPTGPASASVEENYDTLGRLFKLKDADGTETSYTYDIGGRLTSVTMPTSYGTQIRRFLYDNLGLLRAECHPELGNGNCAFVAAQFQTPAGPSTFSASGDVIYGQYDSRGNFGAKLYPNVPMTGFAFENGERSYDAFDEFYTYDDSGRVSQVQTRNPYGCGYYPPGTTYCAPNLYRMFKQFTYGTENGTTESGSTNWQKGKLTTATRHNYDPALGHFRITDSYTYGDAAGRITQVQTSLFEGTGSWDRQSFQTSYVYNEMDAITQTTLPTCTGSAGCFQSEGTTLTDVTANFSYGRPTAVGGQIRDANGNVISASGIANTISYHPSGMTATVAHANGISEVVSPDASGIARPARIEFTGAVSCQAPVITQQPQSTVVEPNTPVQLTVIASGNGVLRYQWFRGSRGDMTYPLGTDSPTLNLPGISYSTTYWVRVTNYCGGTSSSSSPSVMAVGGNVEGQSATEASTSVASEEAVLTIGVPAPKSLTASAVTTTSASLTWSGNVSSYQIERRSHGSVFGLVATTTTTSWVDPGLSPGTSYVYRVRGVGSGGAYSDYSNSDLATTLWYTDEPLLAGGALIKAVHVIELRQAINVVRMAAGLAPSNWTDSQLAGVPVKAVHLIELRTALNQARASLGLVSPSYTDPSANVGTPVKAVHFQELRDYAR